MLNQIKSVPNNDSVVIEIVISISEARTLIQRWSKAALIYSLMLEYTSDGIEMILLQSRKRFRVTTGAGEKKYFTDTRSLHKWIGSLFPDNKPDCEISSQYRSEDLPA